MEDMIIVQMVCIGIASLSLGFVFGLSINLKIKE
jgi:hypothetical protein